MYCTETQSIIDTRGADYMAIEQLRRSIDGKSSPFVVYWNDCVKWDKAKTCSILRRLLCWIWLKGKDAKIKGLLQLWCLERGLCERASFFNSLHKTRVHNRRYGCRLATSHHHIHTRCNSLHSLSLFVSFTQWHRFDWSLRFFRISNHSVHNALLLGNILWLVGW